MRIFSGTPKEMVLTIWRHRSLIFTSAKREILGRYRGSIAGLLWSFINPLLMLAVYTFVFSSIFKARWSPASESKTEFAIVLFAGLIVFNLFSECVNRAPTIILSNPNYVKKVIFPLEILPVISLLAALYHALISLGVWLLAYILFFGVPHPSAFLLPIVIVPFCMFLLGLSWFLASLGVFLRDVSQFIGLLTTVVMFLSPIFYPSSAFPESFRALLYLNPLTPVIDMVRDLLCWGILPGISLVLIYWLLSSVIAWMGFAWFQKTRKGFADVL
jgi:lipopolysaccharide transport system permease protein